MLNAYSDQDKLYVHYGARFFRKERMPEVKNGVSFMRSKPSGGLWASPVNAEYGWIDFCKNEEFRDYEEGNRFFFRIDDNARIFHIFCMEDMFQLPEQIDYVRDEDHPYRIDFEKALKDGIDAIELHLSEEKPCEFDKQLRISMPYWDCDCIFIMNPEVIDTRLGFLYDETNPYYFGEEMPDGRLTAEFDNTAYHFREMLRRRNELGRPLTEKEMKEFKIH